MKRAQQLMQLCLKQGEILAIAESCTGGLIAANITEIAGSSKIFDCGFVSYSNASKARLLGVDESLIKNYGAVSEQVAKAMAQGALEHSQATIAISTTGIAGPAGGSEDKPIGTVYIGLNRTGEAATATRHNFKGNRQEVRQQTVEKAYEAALAALTER